MQIQCLLGLSETPADLDVESTIAVESSDEASSQSEKRKLLEKGKSSIGFDMNVYASPSSFHKPKLSKTSAEFDIESNFAVETDDAVSSQRKRRKLLDKVKGSIGLDMNVYASPSSLHKREYHVPSFYDGAYGTPLQWNDDSLILYWGKKTRLSFPPIPGAVVDRDRSTSFFRQRPGLDGEPISNLIGYPQAAGGPWFRCSWLSYTENIYADPGTSTSDANWELAWHDTKFEALYNTMYAGELFVSDDEEKGHRFLPGRPGIYAHSMKNAIKAENYIRFTPLCDDGVMWAAKWEVNVDRSQRIYNKSNGQWVQAPGSVRLVALWLCGFRYEDMPDGVEVSISWNPKLEGHPNPSPDGYHID